MPSSETSVLGRAVDYPDRYDPSLLQPIPRAIERASLGLSGALPFRGVDLWNAYELSWLDRRGKPRIALGEFRVPCESPQLIESKSLKLYLNSFNQEHIGDIDAMTVVLQRDLMMAAGAAVDVRLRDPTTAARELTPAEFDGVCIDDLDIEVGVYGPPQPAVLTADTTTRVDETLVSNLLKSNCPVTGQPDWASVQVRYQGPRIDREGLLRYLLSYRQHSDFHEHCVERIYCDIRAHCAPVRLSVYARYTRRGGLDINPFRSSESESPPNRRGARQ